MKIERLEVLHLKLPLVHFFETSFGRVYDHEVLVVRAESGGLVGYGEVPASAAPRYSYETVQTAWHVIRDFLAQKLKGQEIAGPGPISDLFAFVRGHNMAKAGIEMAVLDLFGKAQGKPIHAILGGTQREIPTGVSLGIEDTVADLLKRVEEGIAQGYRRIKLKIKPKWDVDVVREVRKAFPSVPLMADANSAYSLADIDHLKRLDEFGLMMIEQPLAYDDYVDHAKLQAQVRTPVCLDESIRSHDDARRAFELKACRIINIKQARVGGPYSAKMIHNVARANGAPVWCGGLLETGVGRAHNIALATLPNFTLPGDVSASERYYQEDVIDPPVTVTPQGTIVVPQGPGIGYTVVESRLARYCVRREYVLS
ncbi:MAG TPA: o-succinylbenzoate synthase [Planctomycetota bacterium]|nr:o-succinylbenzoate synthase [Planctomycetota bacterium]